MKMRHRKRLFAVPIAIGLLVSGCGGGAANGSSGAPSPAQAVRQGVAFSVCMRSHGVPNLPDPQFSSSDGGVQATISTRRGPGGINPHSPAFTSALGACRRLLPNGRAPSASGASGAVNQRPA